MENLQENIYSQLARHQERLTAVEKSLGASRGDKESVQVELRNHFERTDSRIARLESDCKELRNAITGLT